MANRNIIVVGASAGGVPALITLMKNMPADFDGSMFIVLHIPPNSPSSLPLILSSAGTLKAIHPKDGEKIQNGKVYVAPPDHHMLLEGKTVLIKKGPKENRFRPSIDALFRSAAYVYGPRVIGIVLSGVLNDGTSGLWSIKRLGGTTIIQDPEDAQHPEMPLNALEYVDADYLLPVKDIPDMLISNFRKKAAKKPVIPKKQLKLLEMELMIAIRDNAFEMGIMNMGELTPFTCPECNGVLIQLVEGKLIRFRCHTGHAYTASALLGDLSESIEHTLWKCMRGLEEITMLLRKITGHFKEIGQGDAAGLFAKKADMTEKRARNIHDAIFHSEMMSEDLRHDKKPIRKVKAKPGHH